MKIYLIANSNTKICGDLIIISLFITDIVKYVFGEFWMNLAKKYNFFGSDEWPGASPDLTYSMYILGHYSRRSSRRSGDFVQPFPWVLLPNVHRRWGQAMLRATHRFRKNHFVCQIHSKFTKDIFHKIRNKKRNNY